MCVYTYIYMYVCMYIYIYIHMYVCMYVCVYIYIYIYILYIRSNISGYATMIVTTAEKDEAGRPGAEGAPGGVYIYIYIYICIVLIYYILLGGYTNKNT